MQKLHNEVIVYTILSTYQRIQRLIVMLLGNIVAISDTETDYKIC